MSLANVLISALLRFNQRSAMALSPEHRFRRSRKMLSVDCSRVGPGITVRPDVLAGVAVEWVLPTALSGQAGPLIMAGDSAGGNIALATAQAIRDAQLGPPTALVLFSPWLDLRNTSLTCRSNASKDVLLNVQMLDEAVALYAPNQAVDEPRLSPLLGNLANLPPCRVPAMGTRTACVSGARAPSARRPGGSGQDRCVHPLAAIRQPTLSGQPGRS